MSEMQDYASSLADTSSRKFETFSYLPEMDAARIRKQVEFWLKPKPATKHIRKTMSAWWVMITMLNPKAQKWSCSAVSRYNIKSNKSLTAASGTYSSKLVQKVFPLNTLRLLR